MTARIHFEDNFFMLQSKIQFLKQAMSLDIDPEFFLERLMSDFFFVDSCLDSITEVVCDNSFLVKKQEYLRSLIHCKQEFVHLANGIAQGLYTFSAHCRTYQVRILDAIQRQDLSCHTIRREFLEGDDDEDREMGLSSDEYSRLLAPVETEDETTRL